MFTKAFAVWLSLAVLAIMNGALRESVISRRLGEQASHIVSTLLLCALILAATWVTLGWLGPLTDTDALIIGSLWLVMTLAFEFLAGHYLFGIPFKRLLADYNVARGRIWPLVLVTTLLAPWLVRLIKH